MDNIIITKLLLNRAYRQARLKWASSLMAYVFRLKSNVLSRFLGNFQDWASFRNGQQINSEPTVVRQVTMSSSAIGVVNRVYEVVG